MVFRIQGHPPRAPRSLTSNLMYCVRKLFGHSSCVNALAFSSGDGRFLASGGDGKSLGLCTSGYHSLRLRYFIDMQIQIWDFHQNDVNVPSCSFRGPRVRTYLYPLNHTDMLSFVIGQCFFVNILCYQSLFIFVSLFLCNICNILTLLEEEEQMRSS